MDLHAIAALSLCAQRSVADEARAFIDVAVTRCRSPRWPTKETRP